MTKESTLRLMECKLQAFKNGFWKARANKDYVAAEKWKDGCKAIQERITELKQE